MLNLSQSKQLELSNGSNSDESDGMINPEMGDNQVSNQILTSVQKKTPQMQFNNGPMQVMPSVQPKVAPRTIPGSSGGTGATGVNPQKETVQDNLT